MILPNDHALIVSKPILLIALQPIKPSHGLQSC